MPSNKDFGQKLRELREENDLTQSKLAKQIGVDFTYLSRIENGYIPGENVAEQLIMTLDNEERELEILYVQTRKQDFNRKIIKFRSRVHRKALTVLAKFSKQSE